LKELNFGIDLDKLIIALDNVSYENRQYICDKFDDKVAAFKVNHVSQSFMAAFTDKLMYDVKLSDIPSTNKSVVEFYQRCNMRYITIMMNNSESAYGMLAETGARLIGVTALTSMSEDEYKDIYGRSIGEGFERSIRLMEKFNFYGAVCAPTDLPYFKGSELKTFCPGIRMEGDDVGDQIRTMTPKEAVKNGADYIIMGRSFLSRIDFKLKTKKDPHA
jgi:orotidine-5'-phosphate decarboxylase